jgi:hypothetical protein
MAEAQQRGLQRRPCGITPVGHFVIQAVIVVLLTVKGGGSGHPDHVILGGVISSESSVMNRTELRAIDHSCGSFERLGSIDWWHWLAA